jgi:hypothetical protein
MRAQSILLLSALLSIVPFTAASTCLSETDYRGSGRLEVAYRGSGRLEVAYRGSGRLETAYRGSGRITLG